MQVRRLLAVLGIIAVTTVGLPAASQAAPQGPVAPRIAMLPNSASYSLSQDTVKVRVRYRCTNTTDQVHYLVLTVAQRNRARYSMGFRNDNGGLLEAKCTGRTVAHRVTLLRGSYETPGTPRARRGPATFDVTLQPRSVPANGGYYVPTGSDVSKSRTVKMVFKR